MLLSAWHCITVNHKFGKYHGSASPYVVLLFLKCLMEKHWPDSCKPFYNTKDQVNLLDT